VNIINQTLQQLSRDISSFLPTGLEFSFKEIVHSFYTGGLGCPRTKGRLDSLDAWGIDLVTRHRVSNDIPCAEVEAGVRIGCSLGKTECHFCPFGHVEIPYPYPFKRFPLKKKLVFGFPT